MKTKRSILFLAVTGEEKGELGSLYFAAHHPTVPGRIVADINMDMFLPLFPLRYLEVQGLNESTLGDDIRAVGAAAKVEIQADKEPNANRFIRSDQYSFIKKGVPALAFKFGWIPGSPEEKIFKHWYSTRYHGVADDTSQPVDLAAAAQFDSILTALLERVAERASSSRVETGQLFPPVRLGALRHIIVEMKKARGMAERGRFELPEPVKVQRFSRPPQSTTLPPLRDDSF